MIDRRLDIAIVGATGLVGRTMLEILSERGFPTASIRAFSSERSVGTQVQCGAHSAKTELVTPGCFESSQIVLMSAGGQVSLKVAEQAAREGAIVIDNSSAWRMDPEVPLVVPEVNPDDLKNRPKGIIANPNCSTIQLAVALQPLHERAKLKRVVVATYQSVSGAGKEGMDELATQVTRMFNSQDLEPKKFSKQIGFNCLPHIDVFLDDGSTKEERKMVEELRKIMGLPDLAVSPTCVRVPTFNGHAEAVNVTFEEPLSADDARDALNNARGVFVMDDPKAENYPTQKDVDGSDATFVGRIRNDPSAENALSMWVVADNLRKGAATNSVQIAELLARDHLQGRS